MINSISDNIQALGTLSQDMAGIADRVSKVAVPGSEVDLATEFVDMMMVENAFEANVKAIKTENETLGSLVDALG
jgi:flagellar hook protein FlgE